MKEMSYWLFFILIKNQKSSLDIEILQLGFQLARAWKNALDSNLRLLRVVLSVKSKNRSFSSVFSGFNDFPAICLKFNQLQRLLKLKKKMAGKSINSDKVLEIRLVLIFY